MIDRVAFSITGKYVGPFSQSSPIIWLQVTPYRKWTGSIRKVNSPHHKQMTDFIQKLKNQATRRHPQLSDLFTKNFLGCFLMDQRVECLRQQQIKQRQRQIDNDEAKASWDILEDN
jgi:hypothetical protein